MTRGIIIGQIIDNLSNLKNQINLRAKLGFLDLNKVSEDFFKEIFNIVYKYSLVNLNESRCNEPGLDLGDEFNKIAFQITGTKTSQKIQHTLEKITKEQLKVYNDIFIFIVGDKQSKYTIADDLVSKVNFNINNILDLNDLCRDIVSLDIDQLYELKNIFDREFNMIKVELEVPDENGNYETSLYNNLEKQQFVRAKNYNKLYNWSDEMGKNIYSCIDEDLNSLFDILVTLPRLSREFHLISQERSKNGSILLHLLQRHMNFTEKELIIEVQILKEEDLCEIDTIESYEEPDRTYYRNKYSETLDIVIAYAKDNAVPIRDILVKLNFSHFEEKAEE